MYREHQINRRAFVKMSALAAAGAASIVISRAGAQDKGARPRQSKAVTVLNPQNRVPLSFIIDDSTCLVNLAHFGIPHFATAWPERYKQDWRKLPCEIPDSFVRKFGQWYREHQYAQPEQMRHHGFFSPIPPRHPTSREECSMTGCLAREQRPSTRPSSL